MIETQNAQDARPSSSAASRRERLGLDCDGVLSNFAVYALLRLNKDMGLGLRMADWRPIVDDSPLARAIGAAVWQLMEDEALWAGLPPYPGTARRVAALRERYDIYVVTAIPDRFSAVRADWLVRAGVAHEGLVCVPGPEAKAGVARELGLDAFVEDLAPTAAEIAAAGIDAYVIRRPWNADLPLPKGVRRGRWSQIVDWLQRRPARR